MINGLMHARERASNELALYMLQVLGNNYGLSGTLGNKVTKILNTTIVYVVPMMNPDGAEYDMSGGKWHRVAQEPPAHPGSERDRDRSQSAVRLHVELLPGRREQQADERLLRGSVGRSTRPRTRPTATSSTAR